MTDTYFDHDKAYETGRRIDGYVHTGKNASKWKGPEDMNDEVIGQAENVGWFY